MQVFMVVLGYFVPWIESHVFVFGGMMIAAIAGYLYGMDSGCGWAASALGGAMAGGTSGIIGVAAAVLLRQTQMETFLLGTPVSILTGTVGGLFGQMAANLRKMV